MGGSERAGASDGKRLRWFALGVAVLAAVGAGAVLWLMLGARTLGPQEDQRQIVSTYDIAAAQCQITDPRLNGVSGLVARNDGLWVANDRGDDILFRLREDCTVADAVDLTAALAARQTSLTDVEDLAVTDDGWLWLADTGGNREPRTSVQLVGWRDKTTPLRVVPLTYPDGPHDVEAVLVTPKGFPVLVTKVGQGNPSQVFTTAEPIADGVPQQLIESGTITLVKPEGTGPGSRLASGGAVAPGGRFAVLRTYTNAWEFDVVDGDVAGALVGGQTPRLVPLPPSAKGEAITYSSTGTSLLATGEGSPVALDVVNISRRAQ